jgi:hypothetical protein
LLIGVSGKANKNLLRQKVRRAPIEMEIDAAAVLRVRVLEIVGEAGNVKGTSQSASISQQFQVDCPGAADEAVLNGNRQVRGADRYRRRVHQ